MADTIEDYLKGLTTGAGDSLSEAKGYFFPQQSNQPLTATQLAARNELVKAMLTRRQRSAPKTIGEGIYSAASDIADSMQMNDLLKQQQLASAASIAARKDIYGNPVGPNAPVPGAAVTPDAPFRQQPVPVRTVPVPVRAPPATMPGAAPRLPSSFVPSSTPAPEEDRRASADGMDTEEGVGIEDNRNRLTSEVLQNQYASNNPMDWGSFPEASEPAGTPMPMAEPAAASERSPSQSLEGLSGGVLFPAQGLDRSRFVEEIRRNPQLIPRMAAMVQGEGSDPRLMTETLFNRAAARGTPLERELEIYTGPGSRGYYPQQSFTRGQYPNFERDILNPVLAGSDVGGQILGFSPTGNASGDVASRGVASGRYPQYARIGGETFVTQESPARLAQLEATRMRPSPETAQLVAEVLSPRPMATDARNNPPIVSDIPVGDRTAPGRPGTTPEVDTLPPRYEMAKPVPPTVPEEQPKTPRQLKAERALALQGDDPDIAQVARQVIGEEEAVRAHRYQRDVEAYKAGMVHYTSQQTMWEKQQAERRKNELEERDKAADIARKAQDYRANEPIKIPSEMPASADQPYNPLLGGPRSPQRTGVPDLPPNPGLPPSQHRALYAPTVQKFAEASLKAGPEFEKSIRLIDELIQHPGLKSGTGFASNLTRATPGTTAYDFNTRLKQIEGENFLAGYETLRGAGAITEKEGAKTEAARGRTDPNQSTEAFMRSMKELGDTIRSDYERMQRRMNQPVTAWQRNPGDPVAPDRGEILTLSPETARRIGVNGTTVRYNSGDPRNKNSYTVLQ